MSEMKVMTYGSVCSGIEAASVAWESLGWQADWLAEIEPFPSAVLAHRFPDVPNLGDMTRIPDQVANDNVPAPDVLVGGTPCQTFSVAGARKGLADERGFLTIKFVELANAIDQKRAANDNQPAIIVWENVPGVLSDKGNAFGAFLGLLSGEDVELQPAGKRWSDAGCVYGPTRAVAWRVLDAQYFGLAQRRRRVFVVASARDGFDPAAVLFEREGKRRDTAPSRGEGQNAAGAAAAGLAFGGGNTSGPIDPAACLTAKGMRQDFEVETFVVHGTQDPDVRIDHAHTIGRNNGAENAVLAFSCKDYGADAGELAPTLRAMGHGESHANAGGQVAVCITGDTTHTLKAEGFVASEDTERVTHYQEAQFGVAEYDTSGSLRAGRIPEHEMVLHHSIPAVRRLTPVECERLQGFPDDWTKIPWGREQSSQVADGVAVQDDNGEWRYFKPAPDGPRYKAIGNSMAVPCMAWIGRRIAAQLATQAIPLPTNDNTLQSEAIAS